MFHLLKEKKKIEKITKFYLESRTFKNQTQKLASFLNMKLSTKKNYKMSKTINTKIVTLLNLLADVQAVFS